SPNLISFALCRVMVGRRSWRRGAREGGCIPVRIPTSGAREGGCVPVRVPGGGLVEGRAHPGGGGRGLTEGRVHPGGGLAVAAAARKGGHTPAAQAWPCGCPGSGGRVGWPARPERWAGRERDAANRSRWMWATR
ncbi:unnamed protein product, partial [Urochloa humidicola]